MTPDTDHAAELAEALKEMLDATVGLPIAIGPRPDVEIPSRLTLAFGRGAVALNRYQAATRKTPGERLFELVYPWARLGTAKGQRQRWEQAAEQFLAEYRDNDTKEK